MEQLLNFHDLLQHEVDDLYSAEEQIIEALPKMIEKAENPRLKAALTEHLAVTRKQKDRLDQVKKSFRPALSKKNRVSWKEYLAAPNAREPKV